SGVAPGSAVGFVKSGRPWGMSGSLGVPRPEGRFWPVSPGNGAPVAAAGAAPPRPPPRPPRPPPAAGVAAVAGGVPPPPPARPPNPPGAATLNSGDWLKY